MDATSTNIMTVEDPIEFDLTVWRQQVDPRIDMTLPGVARYCARIRDDHDW